MDRKLNYHIRLAQLDDLPRCLEIDAGYITHYVWQMEERFQNPDGYAQSSSGELAVRSKILGKVPSPTPDEYHISFRPSRLPRPLSVPPRLNDQTLLSTWRDTDYLLVAETIPGEADLGLSDFPDQPLASEPVAPIFPEPELIGYIGLHLDRERHLGWLTSYAVQPVYRRKGVGLSLYQEARKWADRHRLRAMMVELETKNYPALQFFQQNNFFLCGYNSAYYLNRDIALFFACRLEVF